MNTPHGEYIVHHTTSDGDNTSERSSVFAPGVPAGYVIDAYPEQSYCVARTVDGTQLTNADGDTRFAYPGDALDACRAHAQQEANQ